MAKSNYVTDFGGNGQTIVLLHGFLSSSKYWARLQPRLSRAGYRVVTVDLLGFGKAPKPSGIIYSYEDHVEHIHKVTGTIDITGPFILAGHSMGALLAARYAQQYGENVKSLILLHPPLYRDRDQASRTIRNTAVYRFLFDSRFRRPIWEIIQHVRPFIIGSHSHEAREMSLQNVIERATIFEELECADTKTLVLAGLRDRKVYRKNIEQARFSSSVRLIVEDVGHNSPVLNPGLVFQHMIHFLNQAQSS